METLLPGNTNSQSYSPQLKTVLKTYQLSAVKSLQGPSSALLGMDCKGLLQEQATFRFSPPNCTGNCGLDSLVDRASIKELEKREDSPVPIATPSKDLRVDPPHEDSDDDPPERSKVCEKRELEFQIPILTAPDQSCSERCETILEGERISCFVVGGERRLCLPQILNTVLQDFSLQQINQVCDELQIYCSRCTRDQLEELKLSGILPRNAPSCGLITQTDAERLVSALLSRAEPYLPPSIHDRDDIDDKRLVVDKKDIEKESISRFKVYHECFGKCKGIFDADSFASEDSACIECLECGCRLSPQRFVRHAHGSLENRTCHWGFDSSNWRSYLLLSRDQQHYNKVANFFRDLKERHLIPNSKRKLELQHESEKLMKKLKKDIGRDEFAGGVYNGNGLGLYHTASPAASVNDPYLRMQWAVFELAAREASAFRPWNPAGSCKHRESSPLVPAYLSRGPPVLQHPERVVPMSECERFEPHFQPNVALAPPTGGLALVQPPPAPPPPPPPAPVAPATTSVVQQHRRHHHHRRHHLARSLSPEDEKPIPELVTVKIEKPSSPCSLPTETSDPRRDNEHSKQIDNEEEEEEGSAAVTSSTSTTVTEPSRNESAESPSLESCEQQQQQPQPPQPPPPASANVTDIDCTSLEERLLDIDAPQDTLELARRLIAELNGLRRENAKLRTELSMQQSAVEVKCETADSTEKPGEPIGESIASPKELSCKE